MAQVRDKERMEVAVIILTAAAVLLIIGVSVGAVYFARRRRETGGK